ncbi:glycosyltransferase [Leuconostoc citreum]|uniref:glycosyltransferase n=1 Tax=Leuconostoc citreum TaxID=33964 RepID=UPI0011BBF38B|nr:glycosyltransferase [Leuconostoc citreum]QEA45932.1 glycosyltransferase [Leuconostoc citreum]QEA62621.1 glycosyltransferase [Leuconostoc citreum]
MSKQDKIVGLNKSKKVVFHFLNTGNYSGAENVVINIANMVDNYEHVYVSPDGKINEILKGNNIRHISIKKLSLKSFYFVIKKYEPDIVHLHDFKASIIGGFLHNHIRRYGGRIVSQIHKNDKRMAKWSMISVLYGSVLNCFDRVVVVSESVVNEYIFRNKLKNKSIVVSNIVDYHKMLCFSKKNNPKSFDIVYVARMSDEKGPMRFLDIIDSVNQKRAVTVVWIGDGQLKEQIEAIIKTKHLDKVIKLIGFQSNPYPFIRKSKIAILTSKFEGFGLSALEAQLMGNPVVATNVGGLSNIINSETGLLTNDNTAFVNEIVKLLENKNYYKMKHEAALKHSQVVNDIDEFIRVFTQIYEVG